MRRFLKATVVSVFLLLGISIFSASTSANFPVENPSVTESAVSPKTLYVRNCARCHGADGKSQNELGQTLEATDLTTNKTGVKRNIQVITKGMGAMPAFGKKLKKADITALANYVRSL